MELEFIGIEFRSLGHLYWFIGTCSLFASSVLSVLVLILWKRLSKFIVSLVFSFAGGHFAVAVMTAVMTEWGTKNGLVYSGDCIWFNGMAACAYVLLFVFAVSHTE